MANLDLNTTKASEIEWGGRAEAALNSGKLMDKTLAEIASMSDEELLSVERLGQVSLKEIRAKTSGQTQIKARSREEANVSQATPQNGEAPQRQTRARNRESDVMEFAMSRPNLIRALMEGEVSIDYGLPKH